MTNLPSFSNLTPGFPQEAVDSLHRMDVNLSVYSSLKCVGYDEDLHAQLYEDQDENIFALMGEYCVIYSINKKGNPITSIFRTYYRVPFSNTDIGFLINGILRDSFKNTGTHDLIYMDLSKLIIVNTDSFSGFQGNIMATGITSKTIDYIFNVTQFAFRNAVGGIIFIEDDLFNKLDNSYTSFKDGNYYVSGTPMMVKPYSESPRIQEISIGTVSLREYSFTEDSDSYIGKLGDEEGNYAINVALQNGTYIGTFGIIGEIPYRKKILFTKNSVFKITRKNVTIDEIRIVVEGNSPYSAPIIPYIPSMTTSIRGFVSRNVGTMDLRDVSWSSKGDVNLFFGLTYNAEDTVKSITSFSTCTGTLQITSAQKTLLDTISGLIVPLSEEVSDSSIVGTLYDNSSLYLSVTSNTSESTSGSDSP